MPKPKPSTLGAVLRFFRFASGWTHEELAQALDVQPALISDYERGRKALSRERLEELMAMLAIPPEAIDAAIYAYALAFPPEDQHGSPVDLSPAERRGVHQASAVAGLKAAEATREKLTANLRQRRATRARREAEAIWKTWSGMPPEHRRKVVEKEPRYWTWALAELLCAESVRAAAHRADQAVELAGLALRVAELAPGSQAFRSRLQGFVWAFVANARRVQGDLPGAEEAFGTSDRLWSAGNSADQGLLDASRPLDLKASLRCYQNHFQDALLLLEKALAASQSGEARGRLLVKKAVALRLLGDFGHALAMIRQAEPLLSHTGNTRNQWVLRFNMAANLLELERYQEAEALMPTVRSLASSLGNELDGIRSIWLEGRLAERLGHKARGAAALEQVRRYFTAHKIAYDAALASLEVAALALEEGRVGTVKRLAAGMLWIFDSQGIPQQALAALRLFCEAAQREEASVGLARQVASFIAKAHAHPELRFDQERGS